MLSIPRMYSKTHLLTADAGYRSENLPSIPRMYSKTHLLIAGMEGTEAKIFRLYMYVITHLLTAKVGYMSKKLSSLPCAASIRGIELYALLSSEVGHTYQLHCLEYLWLVSA